MAPSPNATRIGIDDRGKVYLVESACDKVLPPQRKKREDGDADIRAQLKRAIGEGIRLQVFGIIFFLIGIAAGTASPEISRWLGGAACPA